MYGMYGMWDAIERANMIVFDEIEERFACGKKLWKSLANDMGQHQISRMAL